MTLEEAIRIEIRNGRMEAILVVKAGLDPELLDLETCMAVVRAEGILLISAVNAKIELVVENYLEDPSVDASLIIAAGTAPEPGVDGFIDWEEGFDPTVEACTEQATAEDGRVDYYATSHYRMASEDDLVATVREATLGRDGVGVDGAVIPAHPGKSFNLRTDQSVDLRDDGDVIALQSGLISFESNYLRILNILEIGDHVDFSTGNIEFAGSVVVQKGIRDCFQVTCSEGLTVHGLIEAAHLKVEGDATFNRGMAGREKGTVQIDGSLNARYLECVSGRIGKDLNVIKEILNCNLVIGRGLTIVGGALIGGCTRIGRSVELDIIGSPAGVPTLVSVGDIPELTEALADINKFLPTVDDRLTGSQAELDLLRSAGKRLGPAQRERLTEVQFEVTEWERRQTEMLTRKEEILTILNQHARPSLIIHKRLHSDCIIILRTKGVQLMSELKGPIQIDLNGHGDIMVTDLLENSTVALTDFGDAIDPILAIHAAEAAMEPAAKAA